MDELDDFMEPGQSKNYECPIGRPHRRNEVRPCGSRADSYKRSSPGCKTTSNRCSSCFHFVFNFCNNFGLETPRENFHDYPKSEVANPPLRPDFDLAKMTKYHKKKHHHHHHTFARQRMADRTWVERRST